MHLDLAAKQTEFADLVGISQPAVAGHLRGGTLPENGTLRQWLLAYCERLRLEASGRAVSDARERRDLAIARQAEAKAELDERELYRQDGLILDTESVRHTMTEWATVARNEFIAAIENTVTAIESQHGIAIERTLYQPEIDAALRAIGSYSLESVEADMECPGELDT